MSDSPPVTKPSRPGAGIRWLAIAALVALAVLNVGDRSCVGRRSPEPPEEARLALALLELAARGEVDRDELARLVQEDLLQSAGAASLMDSLESLRETAEPEIVRVEPMPELNRAAIDVKVTLAGGGTATYSFQAERSDAGWRVVWFAGPGVAWPRKPRGPGENLSTSPSIE